MAGHATTVKERPLSALDVIYGRRSVRSYTPETLERSTLRGLLDAAVQAPTAMHQQPWLFVVVQNRQTLARLSDQVKARWASEAIPSAARGGGGAPGLHDAFLERLRDPAFDVFYGAAALVVICARRVDPFVTADCWLAAENLMLAATALGLSSCCIGAAVETLNTPDAKALLRIPAEVQAVAPIVVGVAATVDPASQRADPQIVSWL
jgi:nitroreductase